MTGRRTFIFMGVSGCGKTTIAERLAAATGGIFLDGDNFHPPANIAKMSKGIPLEDSDRDGWIAALADAIECSETPVLCVACSALKKRHRDKLRESCDALTFVYLHGPKELLAHRLAARSGHFMPAGLLDSQLADLQPPADAFRVDIALSPAEILATLREKFGL